MIKEMVLCAVIASAIGFACGAGYQARYASIELEAARNTHKSEIISLQGQLDKARADAVIQARDTERKAADDMAAAYAEWRKGMAHVEAENQRLDAAVRDGDMRLRKRFACPAVAGDGDGVPQASTPAAGADGIGAPAGFGEADARAAVRIADDGDMAIGLLSLCMGIVKRDRGISQ